MDTILLSIELGAYLLSGARGDGKCSIHLLLRGKLYQQQKYPYKNLQTNISLEGGRERGVSSTEFGGDTSGARSENGSHEKTKKRAHILYNSPLWFESPQFSKAHFLSFS